jgi:hypothetical protein
LWGAAASERVALVGIWLPARRAPASIRWSRFERNSEYRPFVKTT